MAKGWRTVNIRETRLKELQDIYEQDKKRPKNQEFSGWLDNFLLIYVEYQKELKQFGPFFEFINAHEDTIYLHDHRKNKPVTIRVDGKKKELQCDLDHSVSCLHVGFCFAVPEVYKVLIERGFKTW